LNTPTIVLADTPIKQEVLQRLMKVIEQRRGADPSVSYVARLLSKGNDAILKKIGEEATEVVMAAKDGVTINIVNETADLWFHCLVMLAHHNVSVDEVLAELSRREGLSGLDEKASRKAQDREHQETPKS
jgi:phosphoribosyl-ATP pyrophosphohydrolase